MTQWSGSKLKGMQNSKNRSLFEPHDPLGHACALGRHPAGCALESRAVQEGPCSPGQEIKQLSVADMRVTTAQLFATITPLVIALHERRVLDIAEVPHYYEDAVIRRLERGGTVDEVAFQQELMRGFLRMARVLKDAEKGRPA